MKVLLLGGTGAIGIHLAAVLNQAGIHPYVTTRSEHSNHADKYFIRGNAKDTQFLSSVLSEGWDAVVDFMNYSVDEFKERMDILLDKPKCYYFLSSSRVYADTVNKPITENSSLLIETARDPLYLASKEYGLAKAEEESMLRQSGKTNWTIFRPYMIYSENRFQLGSLEKEDWLYRVLQGKSIILHDSLVDKQTTLTYAHDAADVMSNIILEGKSNSQIYNIAGSHTCIATWGEIAEIYRDILQENLGYKIDVKYISDKQAHQLRKGVSFYQTSHDRMFYRVFDNTKTLTYKDTNAYISIREGLNMCLSKFMENPHFTFVNQAQEALLDRFTGESSNIFQIPSIKSKLVYLYYRLIRTN